MARYERLLKGIEELPEAIGTVTGKAMRYNRNQDNENMPQENPEVPQEQTTLQKALDYLGRPAAVARAGTQSYLNDEDYLKAMSEQLHKPSEQAPSGADIAETVGKKADIQNPYALGTLATLADVGLDPLAFIPGEKIAGLAPKAMRALRGVEKATPLITKLPGEATTTARALETAIKNPKQYGSVIVAGGKDARPAFKVGIPESSMSVVDTPMAAAMPAPQMTREEIENIIRQFPIINRGQKLIGK